MSADQSTYTFMETNKSPLEPTSTLPCEFSRGGFDFEQLERIENVALFVKRKPNVTSFEVIIIQTHAARNIFGREYDARESLPATKDWGVNGWTLLNLARGQEKLHEIAQERGFLPARTPVHAFSDSHSVTDANADTKEAA